jgi:hypothetical protein
VATPPSDPHIRVAPGFGGKEALLFKSKPTNLASVKDILLAFATLRQKHPESADQIDNLEGAVHRIALQLSNAATMISTAIGQHQVNQAIEKARKDAEETR